MGHDRGSTSISAAFRPRRSVLLLHKASQLSRPDSEDQLEEWTDALDPSWSDRYLRIDDSFPGSQRDVPVALYP
jgi:hypothetical protein